MSAAPGGYENLASTKLLATHCAVCGRPLREAGSVEVSVGPDCRQKYGYDDVQVSAEVRAEANQLIYLIADRRRGPPVLDAAQRLRELGFTKLAGKILSRLLPIRVERHGEELRLYTPFDEHAVHVLRKVAGRRWVEGANVFPYEQRNAVWAALRSLYPGRKMLGPDGQLIEIPDLPAAQREQDDVTY